MISLLSIVVQQVYHEHLDLLEFRVDYELREQNVPTQSTYHFHGSAERHSACVRQVRGKLLSEQVEEGHLHRHTKIARQFCTTVDRT
jgi:hypothetical protein